MNKWWILVFVLVGIYVLGTVVAFFTLQKEDKSSSYKMIIFPLEGAISSGGSKDGFFDTSGISATETVKDLKELGKDSSVKGIIFVINSPGGTVVASQEIGDAIKKLNMTTYSVIRDVGASGGYWIASTTDKIFAQPMSITGSIGVLGSYLEFSKFFETYGIGYERLNGGEYKDLGTPYKSLTSEEKKLLQLKIDKIHTYFIEEVSRNRNMDVALVRKIATGEFYLGTEAKDLGLIDAFGDEELAIETMKKQLNLTDIEVVTHEKKAGLFDFFFTNLAYHMGKGIGVSLLNLRLDSLSPIRV